MDDMSTEKQIATVQKYKAVFVELQTEYTVGSSASLFVKVEFGLISCCKLIIFSKSYNLLCELLSLKLVRGKKS